MSDHAALIERARKLGGHSRTTDAIMRRLADALEQSQRELAFERLRSFDMEMDERAVAGTPTDQFEALVRASSPYATRESWQAALDSVFDAVEIREGRQ